MSSDNENQPEDPQVPESALKAYKLTYDFHQAAQSCIRNDRTMSLAALGGTLGAFLLAPPAFMMYAALGFAAYIAYDTYSSRQRNVALSEYFNQQTERYDSNVKAHLRPLDESMRNIAPFGMQDLNSLWEETSESPVKAVLAVSIALFVPLALPIYAAGIVAFKDKMKTVEIGKAAEESAVGLQRGYPNLPAIN